MNIAILSSGGDAPGMNAAIRAVTRVAIKKSIKVYAIYQGYNGLIENKITQIDAQSVANIVHKGGTILKSARSEKFREREYRQIAYQNLKDKQISMMIVIGGDGSFTGASIFAKEFGIKIVGIPGTIDNDLYGTDFTIGFDTAVNTVVECVDKIRDTAESHDRLFLIEVMGRNSGFLAIQSAIAVGAQAVIIPEIDNKVDNVITQIKNGLKRNKKSMIVIIAEGEVAGGVYQIGAKIKEHFKKIDMRISILGHIQRGGSPSYFDRVIASRMGVVAVETLLSGKSNIMIGIVNNKIVQVTIDEAINLNKKIDLSLFDQVNLLN